ncbi:MAG: hypothetical protein HY855_18455 [Burkholderiales bacterium]|nr:hypothetical protein [Burkholderiales bacterium]
MHIVAIAWMFVVVLVCLAEATSPQGTVLGAFFTFVFWGALPLSIVLYVLGTPARRRARLAAAHAAQQAAPLPGAASGPHGNGRGHASGEPLAPEREEA